MKLLHLHKLLSVLFLAHGLCSADLSLAANKDVYARRVLCQQAFEGLWCQPEKDPRNCTIHRQFFTHLYERDDEESVSRRDISLSVIDGTVNFVGEEDGIIPKLPLFDPMAPNNYSIRVSFTCADKYCFSLWTFYRRNSELPRNHCGKLFYSGSVAKAENGVDFSVAVPGLINYPDENGCLPNFAYVKIWGPTFSERKSLQYTTTADLLSEQPPLSESQENSGVCIDFSKLGRSRTLFVTFNEAEQRIRLSSE